MKFRIISPSHRMIDWVKMGYEHYAKRFISPFSLTLCELAPEKRFAHTEITKLIEKEGDKILSALNPKHRIIALDEKGQSWSTQTLAKHFKNWQPHTSGIDFIIGGADGLSARCLEQSHDIWSLSALTLPHPLVRIVLAEQLYRATTLLRNHPYHRE